MHIRLAGNNDRSKWDHFVWSHPEASPYHMFAWKDAVEKAYNHRTYYLMAEANKELTGVLPLIYLKPPLLSGKLVSLPFCDVGDVLAINEKTRKGLISEAVALARALGARYIELRGQHGTPPESQGMPIHVQSHKVRMLLNLPGSSEILFNGFKSKLRSQIRKAEKNGLEFKWGTVRDLDDFYMVFSRNMRDLGSPVHSKKWFRVIMHYYSQNVRIGQVCHEGKTTGAGIILTVKDAVSIPWASTLRDYNKLSPNMLLYWNFLKFASDNGYARFDFGRSTPHEGTYKFKAQWGAEPVPLYWYYVVTDNRKFDIDSSHSSRREKAACLWQKLPLGIANSIGPALRKHISL